MFKAVNIDYWFFVKNNPNNTSNGEEIKDDIIDGVYCCSINYFIKSKVDWSN